MSRAAPRVALAAGLAGLLLAGAGCGKYGPPQRIAPAGPEAAPAPSAGEASAPEERSEQERGEPEAGAPGTRP